MREGLPVDAVGRDAVDPEAADAEDLKDEGIGGHHDAGAKKDEACCGKKAEHDADGVGVHAEQFHERQHYYRVVAVKL